MIERIKDRLSNVPEIPDSVMQHASLFGISAIHLLLSSGTERGRRTKLSTVYDDKLAAARRWLAKLTGPAIFLFSLKIFYFLYLVAEGRNVRDVFINKISTDELRAFLKDNIEGIVTTLSGFTGIPIFLESDFIVGGKYLDEDGDGIPDVLEPLFPGQSDPDFPGPLDQIV